MSRIHMSATRESKIITATGGCSSDFLEHGIRLYFRSVVALGIAKGKTTFVGNPSMSKSLVFQSTSKVDISVLVMLMDYKI
jgi:hypothetical protein